MTILWQNKVSTNTSTQEKKPFKTWALLPIFFRKTEPHSPMSYAIEQVIRWSDLSLPELLQELIQDGEARNGFFKLSGIKTETETEI